MKTMAAVAEQTEFEVTRPNNVLSIMGLALPSDNNDKRDCLCPIAIIEIDGCHDFNSCSCIGDTLYRNILSICHRNSSGKFVLTLQNMTRAMNNTRFHFYLSFFCGTIAIRQYVDSFQIVQGR